MTINNICNILKDELFNNNYEYGFVIDNKRYTPTMACGFDYEYYNLTLFQNNGIDIIDVTDQLTIGEQPLVLINKIN